jgi:hypothetical protein
MKLPPGATFRMFHAGTLAKLCAPAINRFKADPTVVLQAYHHPFSWWGNIKAGTVAFVTFLQR